MTTETSGFDKAKYDEILGRGLCIGVGTPGGQVCIEAAVSQAMGLPFNDEPSCVHPAVRAFKVALNDSPRWKSAKSRAAGMYDLGIAQIGSDKLDGSVFAKKLSKALIQELLPRLFRGLKLPQSCIDAAARCELEGTQDAAYAAAYAANAAACAAVADAAYAACAAVADAAYAAADAAVAAEPAAADAAVAADAAADAAYAACAKLDPEVYLLMAGGICLRVLREMECPGVALLDSFGASRA